MIDMQIQIIGVEIWKEEGRLLANAFCSTMIFEIIIKKMRLEMLPDH